MAQGDSRQELAADQQDALPGEAPALGRYSPFAILSLLCGIAACCPLMALLAPIFGLRALVEIRANPQVRGHGTAITGTAVGLLATVAWFAGLVWWHYHARLPMQQGPQVELRAGLAGDIAAFKAGFTGDGSVAADSQVVAFLNELTHRYGEFRDCTPRYGAQNTPMPSGPPNLRIPYSLQFRHQAVDAEACFVTFGRARRFQPNLIFKWKWIRVIDAQRGDVIYPVSAAAEARATP
jgi:hypothetical protein